jgi:propanol-preferring alcohol dehydrogenase
MKAMVLSGNAPIDTSPLESKDVPDPQPGKKEVRLKVSCCAICRTDLHVIEGDLKPQKLPIIPGHQIVGEVDVAGSSCTRLSVGQRIGVAWLRHTCGECTFCTAGQENLCESSRYTGHHADGGYAEYAVVPEDFAYEIPNAFDDVAATPLLCAGIIGYRALRRSELPDKGRLGIYGFGSSAHIVIQIALHRGSEVYVVTRGEGHRQLAREMGAAWVGDDAADMPVKVDSAIIFAPVGELVPPALEALRKGGTLALAGIYMTPLPEMDYERYVFYERDIHSVTANTRDDGRELLSEAARAGVRPHTTTYPLQDANQALQDLAHDRINGTGVLVMHEA